MLLIDARRDARVDDTGAFVRLADQDRAAWNRAQIDEGQALLRALPRAQSARPLSDCRRRSTPCTAMRAARQKPTGAQILALYDQLLALAPSPVVALNRAVVVAEIEGAGTGPAARGSARTSSATTCFTRCARTCCADSAAMPMPRRRIRRRSRAATTRARRIFCSASTTRSREIDGREPAQPASN